MRRSAVVLCALLAATALAASVRPVEGRAIVAVDHSAASEAGRAMLDQGGNAADAAVAAALAAGVVQSVSSSLGGGGFAVVVGPGKRTVLDFREVAPSAAHREMYVDLQEKRPSREGRLAVAVPGESRGLARLLREHGQLRPQQVAAPAIRLASSGFEVQPFLGRMLERTGYPQIHALFTLDGRVARPGDRLRNPALARTLRRWVRSAGEDLHVGEGARAIVEATGGDWITAEDLRSYAPVEREPIITRFREHTLITMPPPSSGGIVLAQALSVLDRYDLAELGPRSSDTYHLLAEVLQHTFADRAHHLGDPAFVEVPVQRLLSEERTQEIGSKIWPTRTFGPDWYGDPLSPSEDAGTQHISVIDQRGMAVALTTTNNTPFGSGVVPPEIGTPLNNEMDDFAVRPGEPNAFGLIGSEANAIAPGKRPLSSMSPTVVLDDEGRVVMAIGASGGSTIISATLQVYLNVAVFGMNAQEAVSAPRIHHQWMPERLMIEPEVPLDVRRSLEARGHELWVRPAYSAVQLAIVRPDGVVEGASDPRKGGWPAALP